MSLNKRIVIKVGSSVLADSDRLNEDRFEGLVTLIADLKNSDYDIILVTSGAIAAGYTSLKLERTLINRQILSSIGQPMLMKKYEEHFGVYGFRIAQILIDNDVFKNKEKLNHSKNVINGLLDNGIIPIINENDAVNIEEIIFGDNDQLSAYVTEYFDAELLVILSDIDGYYDKNPLIHQEAKMIKRTDFIGDISKLDTSTGSEMGTGGIITKLKAANFLIRKGKNMFLTSGFDLTAARSYLLENKQISGTLFGF